MGIVMALEKMVLAGIELGNKGISLMDKLSGPWVTRRQADANAYAEVEQALARQVAYYITSSLDNFDVVEALVSCGGKTGLTNLAKIVQRAAGQLNEDADPSQIDDDWAANYKEKARTCSNEEMADLWAQLLAAEANNPGSYSKKTVNVLADLEPDDARRFRDLADFRILSLNPVYQGPQLLGLERSPTPARLAVIDEKHPIYAERAIGFDSLPRMDWLGLVGYNPNGYQITLDSDMFNPYQCGGEVLYLSGDKPASFGRVTFTPAGAELSELCNPMRPPDGFVSYLAEIWRSQGIRVARSIQEVEALVAQTRDGE